MGAISATAAPSILDGPTLTLGEAAELLGVNPATVRRAIANGTIRGYRVGPRLIRVRKDDVASMCRPIPAGIG